MKKKHCRFSHLQETPDWYVCPDRCKSFGTEYCMQFLASDGILQLDMFEGIEEANDIKQEMEKGGEIR